MRIFVAAGTESRLWFHLRGRHHVARDTRHRGMQALERKRRACVIDFRCAPRLRDVTGRTGGPEGPAVWILMTGAARRERDAFEHVPAVAGFTTD